MTRAIVLAAGFGERLRLNQPIPKPFIQVGGKIVLDRVVEFISEEPISAIYIVHNALHGRLFRKWKDSVVFGVGHRPYLKLYSTGASRIEDRGGAVGDLLKMHYRLIGNESIVVMPVDTLCDWKFTDFWHGIDKDRVTIACVGVSEGQARELGTVTIEPGGKVLSLREKASSHTTLAWLGPLYIPGNERYNVEQYCAECEIHGELPDNLGTFISWLLSHETQVYSWSTTNKAFDIGTPKGLEAARMYYGKKS